MHTLYTKPESQLPRYNCSDLVVFSFPKLAIAFFFIITLFFGLRPWSSILKFIKCKVSETGSVFIIRWESRNLLWWGPQNERISIYRLATGWTTEKSEFESRWGQEFSLLQIVQTGSEVHSTSYPMVKCSYFPGDKAGGAWSWPLTSNECRGQEKWIYTSTPHTPSWRSA
jgi:hypothetical protein